ncbi:MAG: hypothetical protein WCG80_13475 [Spirochaetales bacterium]
MNAQQQTWVSELSPTLFWDADRATLDAQQHLKTILERVLERGTWQDWSLVAANVSKAEMLGMLPRLRVPPRELNFVKMFLDKDDLAP